ncbi:unnamed protein product, partial [Penicillium nalgiovense]
AGAPTPTPQKKKKKKGVGTEGGRNKMEKCVFFFFFFSFFFWFVCVAVCSVLCIISPMVSCSTSGQGVRSESAFCFLPVYSLYLCYGVCPRLLPTRMENGVDERRQMTTSRPFSSSRSALPTVAFSTSRDGLCFCTSDLALSFDVSIPIPSILYSLPPGFRFISPAQTLYLLYILTLPILFPPDRVLRRLSFFSFPRGLERR